MLREEAALALAGFHVDPLCWSRLEFGDVVFVKGGKRKEP